MNNPNIHINTEQNETNPNVTFIQYQKPSLSAGEYTLNVTQKTGGSAGGRSVEETFTSSKTFYVGAERFRLNPKAVHAVHPAPASSGDVSNILPNIVLSDPQLPWSRSVGGSETTETPWLALLMFYGDEVPKLKSVTLNDLKSSKLPNDTFYPSIDFKYDQKESDVCQVIDIKKTLFDQMTPSLSDLPYLAHVRKVGVLKKAHKLAYNYHPQNGLTLQEVDPEQHYSVMVCNRLPKPNTECHLFLVSLENMGDYLPDGDGLSKITKDKVRLVTLQNWSFYATEQKAKLVDIVNNLNTTTKDHKGEAFSAPVTLNFPASFPNPESDSHLQYLNNAFKMGYVPLEQHTRLGEKTICWQRSPFVPFNINETLEVPLLGADSLMRYDPNYAMFDTTYASAWQLGKLLCLQNKGFAYQLYQWKQGQTISAINKAEQDALKQDSEILKSKKLSQHLLESSILPMMEAFVSKQGKKAIETHNLRQKRAEAIEHSFNELDSLIAEVPEQTSEEAIVTWLARLQLLYGVPYRYLIPHDDLLPAESIKIFHIDPNYTTALIDGAYSIGRDIELVNASERATFTKLNSKVKHRVANLRNRMFGLTEDETPINTPLTGFLLNSQIVSDFPGLEVTVSDNSSELTILRMEHLSDGVLLCIVNGVLSSIRFSQPSEGLNYGLDIDTSGDYSKALRNQNSSDIGHLDLNVAITDIPFRNGVVNVINIEGLANKISSTLTNNNLAKQGDAFTSADFALQMTEGAEQITLKKIPENEQ